MRFGVWFVFLLLASIATVSHSYDDGMETSDAKSSWPEVVGKTGEEAVAIIQREDENVKAVIVPENAFVTMDYRTDRVRVRVNANGIVVSAPTVG
mmetsp:Transcript_19168/g.32829  ORF Transcript_19168/g.32829 Transcript_19168/m.32829 type:complete len:95 (+) Transcript_19168:146-430(+)